MPNNIGDFSGLTILQLGLPAILVFELWEIIPTIFADSPDLIWYNTLFAIVLFVNTELSVWMTILKDCSLKSFAPELPSTLKPGWTYCHYCQLNAPPRSSHCFSCGTCVLRRDHHCVFTGCCIGYQNHRYFITFILNYWIGAVYAMLANTVYLHHAGQLWSYKDLIAMVLPIPAYIFGYTERFRFATGAMCTLSIVSVIMASGMIYLQILHVFWGQTAFERKHEIKDFAVNWKLTLREIAGRRWYFALLSPLIPSPPVGSGLDLRKASEIENRESIKAV